MRNAAETPEVVEVFAIEWRAGAHGGAAARC